MRAALGRAVRLAVLLACAPVVAAEPTPTPTAADPSVALCLDGPRETVWATRTLAGDTFERVEGGAVRLAGVEPPRPLLADRRTAALAAADALSEAARRALAEAIEGRELAFLDLGEDRWGRRVGHLVDTETGHWVEGSLVEAGRLRVVPTRGDDACLAALLVLEARARVARRGLWADPVFAVRAADRGLLERVGDTVVAEGVVRSVRRSRERTWLNFGDDIGRDFAAVMNDNDRSRLEGSGIGAASLRIDELAGRRVRLRGLVERRGEAPRMTIGEPGALERVEPRLER